MRQRRRDERGTAVVEVTWLSILLLVPLVYVVLSVFEVQRAAFAVNAATRAAGRAYTLADSQAEAAAGPGRGRRGARGPGAHDVARLDGHRLRRRHAPAACRPDRSFTCGCAIPVRLPLMPSALGGNTPSIRVDAEQSVPYGSFREDRP